MPILAHAGVCSVESRRDRDRRPLDLGVWWTLSVEIDCPIVNDDDR